MKTTKNETNSGSTGKSATESRMRGTVKATKAQATTSQTKKQETTKATAGKSSSKR